MEMAVFFDGVWARLGQNKGFCNQVLEQMNRPVTELLI